MHPDPRVYISFAEADRPVVDRFVNALRTLGIETYALGEQSDLHTDLAIEARNAIENSYAILLLVSSSSIHSEAVKEDLEFARTQSDKKIFVVSIDGTEPTADFAGTLWIENGLEHVDQVADALYERRPLKWAEPSEPVVHFSPGLTSAQVRGVLEALSNYWRECGGIGLSVDFLSEEAAIDERVNA